MSFDYEIEPREMSEDDGHAYDMHLAQISEWATKWLEMGKRKEFASPEWKDFLFEARRKVEPFEENTDIELELKAEIGFLLSGVEER